MRRSNHFPIGKSDDESAKLLHGKEKTDGYTATSATSTLDFDVKPAMWRYA